MACVLNFNHKFKNAQLFDSALVKNKQSNMYVRKVSSKVPGTDQYIPLILFFFFFSSLAALEISWSFLQITFVFKRADHKISKIYFRKKELKKLILYSLIKDKTQTNFTTSCQTTPILTKTFQSSSPFPLKYFFFPSVSRTFHFLDTFTQLQYLLPVIFPIHFLSV